MKFQTFVGWDSYEQQVLDAAYLAVPVLFNGNHDELVRSVGGYHWPKGHPADSHPATPQEIEDWADRTTQHLKDEVRGACWKGNTCKQERIATAKDVMCAAQQACVREADPDFWRVEETALLHKTEAQKEAASGFPLVANPGAMVAMLCDIRQDMAKKVGRAIELLDRALTDLCLLDATAKRLSSDMDADD